MILFTKKEAADKLRVSKKTIENYIRRGELEAKRIGGSDKKAGKILITDKALRDFINKS